MPKLKTTDENVFGGEWSVRKLECVSEYLEAYLDVFKNLNWSVLWYIDAFCGSGLQGIKQDTFACEEKSTVEFIEGSAIRALKIASHRDKLGQKTFDHFVFIEFDTQKIDDLKQYVQSAFPDQYDKCVFICDDVNLALPECLSHMNWQYDRGVTFLDPCSLQLEWKTMEYFAGTCMDVWCLFPIEAIIRMLPSKHKPDASWEPKLFDIFGNTDWQNIYYQPKANQLTIFGGTDDSYERNQGIDEVIDYVKNRYAKIFSKVLDPAILRGSRNNPLFALFPLIANPSAKAQGVASKIAKYLVNMINESRV